MLQGGRVISLIAAGLLMLMSQVHAQIYPTRPIRIIISVSAGGTGDIITRAIGEQLSKRLGQPFVLEARPGGNQTIAGRACAEAAPDGYGVRAIGRNAQLEQSAVRSRKGFCADYAPVSQSPRFLDMGRAGLKNLHRAISGVSA